MTTATRILPAQAIPELLPICKAMGLVRADLWRRYGALGNVGKSVADLRKEITSSLWYGELAVDGTIRAETTQDIVNDILAYKEAAKAKVRHTITRRTSDRAERKRLYALLRNDQWLSDAFLHRQMRKHCRHGRSRAANQFVVRSDRQSTAIRDGRLVVTVRIARQYGQAIELVTTSNGQGVDLAGKNLRIIVKDDQVEIHYATEKAQGRPCGNGEIGVDKGYTEALTDSDGMHHGGQFGPVLTDYSDQCAATGKARNKLHALEKKHRAAGRMDKSERIRRNNLGREKLAARKQRTQQHLRTIAYQAAHSVVDKAAVLATEDLTLPIKGKVQWKRFNRRMSGWAKGVLAQALDGVCTQREATHVVVNAAYTSQMDSLTGLLEGKRVGDRFYRVNGDVIQADHNAARNVLDRMHDPEITRYMPYQEVRRILLARSSGATERQGA